MHFLLSILYYNNNNIFVTLAGSCSSHTSVSTNRSPLFLIFSLLKHCWKNATSYSSQIGVWTRFSNKYSSIILSNFVEREWIFIKFSSLIVLVVSIVVRQVFVDNVQLTLRVVSRYTYYLSHFYLIIIIIITVTFYDTKIKWHNMEDHKLFSYR